MKASFLDGRKIIVEDQVYLYLFGTSYLGLPYHAGFQDLIKEGSAKFGSSLGSSPNSTPQLSIYEELEDVLSKKYGFEDALLFASGYAAGQAVVNLYHQQNHKVTYGNVAHPALKLESRILRSKEVTSSGDSVLFAVDFIDPITFEKYDLRKVDKQRDKVLIDASHGLGLFDKEIKSLSTSKNIIVCGSLNKAMGINAGVLLCSSSLKQQLMSSVRYKTASAPSPAECYALKNAMEAGLISAQQEKLNELEGRFKVDPAFRKVEGFPVLGLQNNSEKIVEFLNQNDVLIWRNRYPTPTSPVVNRAVFTAAHEEEDVETFFDLVNKFEE